MGKKVYLTELVAPISGGRETAQTKKSENTDVHNHTGSASLMESKWCTGYKRTYRFMHTCGHS